MDWVTADEHADHWNDDKQHGVLTLLPNRGKLWGTDIGAMADELVYRHNHLVKPGHRVIHLGDVAFRTQGHIDYIRRLNGQHFLIKGNHTRGRMVKQLKESGIYGWIEPVKMHKWGGYLFWLSHYAHLTWPQSHYGAFHLFGHSHGMLKNPIGRSMDVGVDCNDYAPVSLQQVVDRLKGIDFRRNESYDD